MRIFHRSHDDLEPTLPDNEVSPAVVTDILAGEPYASAIEAFDHDTQGAEVIDIRTAQTKKPSVSTRFLAFVTAVGLSSGAILALDRSGQLDNIELFAGPAPVESLSPLPEPLFSGLTSTTVETSTSTSTTTTTTLAVEREVPVVTVTTAVKPTTVQAPVDKWIPAPADTVVTPTTSVPKTTSPPPVEKSTTTTTTTTTAPPVESRPELRYMSSGDMVNAYYNAQPQPDTVYGQKPEIYGDPAADEYIRKIAESRGYRLQPVSTIGSLNPRAMRAFNEMANAAAAEGIDLWIVSGYRSPDTQREIFHSSIIEYFGRTPSSQEILSGAVDDAINKTLNSRSAPGYSRHHSGYVVDINSVEHSFKYTDAYAWLSADNFYHAREHGWVPSYPPGVNAGPLPEEWEFCFIVNTASIQ